MTAGSGLAWGVRKTLATRRIMPAMPARTPPCARPDTCRPRRCPGRGLHTVGAETCSSPGATRFRMLTGTGRPPAAAGQQVNRRAHFDERVGRRVDAIDPRDRVEDNFAN